MPEKTQLTNVKGFYNTQEKRLPILKQIGLQLVCLFILFTVMFPVLWIVSLSLDPRNINRPDTFLLIPAGASLNAYKTVLAYPTANPVSFFELARNQLFLALGTSIFSVAVGVLAAYSFSRFNFRGRKFLMLAVVMVLMLPSIATIAQLFVLLNHFQIDMG